MKSPSLSSCALNTVFSISDAVSDGQCTYKQEKIKYSLDLFVHEMNMIFLFRNINMEINGSFLASMEQLNALEMLSR